jgi:hypothetical protein
MMLIVEARPTGRSAEDRPVQAHIQNAVAALAVALAIAMLGLTLVVPHRSLLTTDTAALYADAG